MGTSIGPAIDYLISGTSSTLGTTLGAALTAADPAATLVDGIATELSQSMVFIGKAGPDSATTETGSQALLVLGAGRAQEDYDIPCFAYAFRPGPTVKPARDAAILLFDTVAHFVASDRTLGGLLLQGRFAEIGNVDLNQDVDDETGATRIVWLSFSIHCRNHYIP